MMPLSLADLPLVCPQCQGPVRAAHASYACDGCSRVYPVLFGIPDFRVRSDRYLDLQAETAKATRLAEAAATRSFEQLLDFYYEITDDVPPELARLYKASILNGIRHADLVAVDLMAAMAAAPPDAIALDAGCGAGAMLVAADRRGVRIVGVDIALRWLVICRKRLDELGLPIPLICADLSDPPFAAQTFDALTAIDLVEHVPDIPGLMHALAMVSRPGAPLWLTSANGRTVGPHPSTRLWAIGWLPAGIRTAVVKKLRGVDSLRFSNLISPLQMRRIAECAGFAVVESRPRRIAAPDRRYPYAERMLIRLYQRLGRLPLVDRLLLHIGPAFELYLHRGTMLTRGPRQ